MRTVLVVVLGIVLSSSLASAQFNVQAPNFIKIVGMQGGVPDPAGTYTVTVRDFANNPVTNAQVVLDFSACPDTKLCQGSFNGQNTQCFNRSVRKFTNGQGQASFIVVGAGTNHGGSSGPGAGCMSLFVNGFPIKTVTANVFDQNGAYAIPGVEVTDLSVFLVDYGIGTYWGRSDFSGDGQITVLDLSVFLAFMGTGHSSEGCGIANLCP